MCYLKEKERKERQKERKERKKRKKEKKDRKKERKKEKKEKEEEKDFSFVVIPLLGILLCCSSVTSFVSRLASLACTSLGPAQ